MEEEKQKVWFHTRSDTLVAYLNYALKSLYTFGNDSKNEWQSTSAVDSIMHSGKHLTLKYYRHGKIYHFLSPEIEYKTR